MWCDRHWDPYSQTAIFEDSSGASIFALGDKPTSPPKRYAIVEGVKVPMTHLTVAPKYGDSFWYVGSYGHVTRDVWYDGVGDINNFAYNNCYATEADAQEAATAKAQVWKIAFERAK